MSTYSLPVETLHCYACDQHKPLTEFSNNQRKNLKRLGKLHCKKCRRSARYVENVRDEVNEKYAVTECVVCGSKVSITTNTLGTFQNKKCRWKPVCSSKCRKFFNKAVSYVTSLHGISKDDAVDVVVTTWFDRRLKEHGKNIRIQAGNAQGDAVVATRKNDCQSGQGGSTTGKRDNSINHCRGASA